MPATALLLEDQFLIAMNLEASLTEVGYQVKAAMSCADAHRWLDQNRPDVAIVDVRLQDGRSDSVAARLLELGVPFVVHSGDVPSQYDGTPFENGVWLEKPSGVAELKSAINASMQRPS